MKHKRIQRILCFAVPPAAAAGFVLARHTLMNVIGNLWHCPVYRALHIYCPGCGISRSLRSLLQLDLVASVRYNIFPLCALILGILLYAEWGTALFGRHRRLFPRSGRFWAVFGAVSALYCVVRNLVELMPPE